ncbi:nucleoside-diphosphate sugar epimerase/dehydratase [uncultured Aeromicrobium sp.]|uniref:nucleoside-diphosphate sugar epimerase/dehydratase n=1 Tax=uncultured Aeromicrobium sp. TaxID=337820 RepID=UPI0025E25CA5|nr:hypothetical protein [uncultured Aeromicrobium sp.]
MSQTQSPRVHPSGAVAPRGAKLRTGPAEWERRYARNVAITDALVVTAAAGAALITRFGVFTEGFGDSGWLYAEISALLSITWFLALGWGRTRDPRILGDGPDEYVRIFNTTLFLFGLVAIFSFIVQFQTSRGFLLIALPVGLVGLLLSRKLWRRRMQRHRAKGRWMHDVMVIGGVESAGEIARWLARHPSAGYRVSGVWIPDADINRKWLGIPDHFIPVFGSRTDLEAALLMTDASIVLVSDTEHLGHRGLKQLSWDLHDLDIELMVAPNVMDVAVPRVHIRSVANMPRDCLNNGVWGPA